jgi:manganese transport protein
MHRSRSSTGRQRRRIAGAVGLLGPAFVAGIAYVDPGNVATNTTAGARHGYLLVWVVVASNLAAILVQYLSAKLGIASGRSLAQLCREQMPRPVALALWLQAETVALATDVAEVLGGAIALQLLFGMPLLRGGIATGAVSFTLLLLQRSSHLRTFERVIVALMGVIALGFIWTAVDARPSGGSLARGLTPAFDGSDSILLATGILGATVMPHAIYLHSALVVDRFETRSANPGKRRQLLRATRVDVSGAMAVAGAVNVAMLVMAAAALRGTGTGTIEQAHHALETHLGSGAALLFALALLASGLASTSVGTLAGTVILDGFLRRRIPLLLRRAITLVPALALLALGVDPTQTLLVSQVVLSFGIPFALIPLVRFTSTRSLMGALVNPWPLRLAAWLVTGVICLLNLVLLELTFTGH